MATKARMHWFWRMMIALPLAWIVNATLLVKLDERGAFFGTYAALFYAVIILLTALPSMLLYALLTRHLGPPMTAGETCCRKCGHILRGLSEPRCPECGEGI